MAAFDFGRLERTQYDLDVPARALSFQIMAEDFMDVVRTNPGFLDGKEAEIAKFCGLVMDDRAWPLAKNVVPEFHTLRSEVDHNCGTVVAAILRSVQAKLLPPPINDPAHEQEKKALRRQLRAQIAYIETGGRGIAQATPEELDAIEELTERADRIINP